MVLQRTTAQEVQLDGIAISQGIAIGKFFFMPQAEELISECDIEQLEVECEIERFRRAVLRAKEEVLWLQGKLAGDGVTEGVAILEAHLLIMSDSSMNLQVESTIDELKKNAEFAYQLVVNRYKKRFSMLGDIFFRERVAELQDVSSRILGCLRDDTKRSLVDIPSNSILFAEELSALHVAEASLSRVKAFVTRYGSCTSHAAIVSIAKGIPLVTNIDLELAFGLDGETDVIVDGNEGKVFIHPGEATQKKYSKAFKKIAFHRLQSSSNKSMGFETYDGHHVRLSANVEMIQELEMLHAHGGSGVGLFRSEYAFLSHGQFPTEDEQFVLYRDIVESMKGLPIVIRTFDLGGDKYMACQQIPYENNPFLGLRAIRFLLQERALFKSQLKAVLRALNYGNVSVMFPLITSLSELLDAKMLLQEAKLEVETEFGVKLSQVRIGCMIEVPSAALITDLIAKECDFISIGTNDLVQYTLAVDRGNHALSSLYTPAHPSILRLIKHIVLEANHQGIPVTVCGEVASDTRFTALLLGLGIDEFSVGPRHLAVVKNAIRNTSIVQACKLADRALELTTPQDIQQLLSNPLDF